MMFDVMTVIVAGSAVALVPGSRAAPCSSRTVTVNLTSSGGVGALTDALNCTGAGVYAVALHGRLQIGDTIEVSDQKYVSITGFPGTSLTSTSGSRGIIAAGDTTGMFSVSDRSTLAIQDLVLERGYSKHGGAITVTSSSSLYVHRCSFVNNRASTTGGAIHANHSEIYIDFATFFDNSAEVGGAVYAFGSNVSIDESSFFNSTASFSGGAVYAYDSKVNMNIPDGVFFKNSANISGGAVYAYNSEVSIEWGDFKNNSAFSGGAVYAYGSNVSTKGSDFRYNSATYSGGAVYFNGSKAIIESRDFINNSATYSGGAVYSYGSEVIIESRFFINNSATHSGGAVYLHDSEVIINWVNFVNNSASYSGGAVCAYDSVVIFQSGFFANNTASYSGGAIASNRTVVRLESLTPYGATDAKFFDNAAKVGGAVFAYDSPVGIFIPAEFRGNTASSSGGAIHAVGGSIRFSGKLVEFSRNAAEGNGGAIAIIAPSEVNFTSVVFLSNNATIGGAMYLDADDGPVVVSNSTFYDNYAIVSGGAIYLVGRLDLVFSNITSNRAGEEGMAISSICASSWVEFTDVYFARNTMFCPFGQYQPDQNADASSVFHTVCKGCSAVINEFPDGVLDSDEWKLPGCNELPTGTIAQSSGTTTRSITLEKGYYRDSYSRDVILKCYRTEACAGGDSVEDYCTAGYEGAYCSTCSEGYSPGTGYSCRDCSGDKTKYAVAVAMVVVVVSVLAAVLILRHLAGNVNRAPREIPVTPQDILEQKMLHLQDVLTRALPLTAIKIVVVVWQIVFQFSAVAEDVFPEEYEKFLSYLSLVNFDISVVVSYSCLFAPDFYGRLLLTTITPLVVLAILGIMSFLAQNTYPNLPQYYNAVRSRCMSAASFVAFVVYSSVSSAIFQTFPCESINGDVFLKADYSISCTHSRHVGYRRYAGVMAIVYPIGIPAIFGWWLVRNRNYLKMTDRQAISHLQPFSGVWGTYRPSRYYFEVVEYGRRLALSMSSVFLVPNSVDHIAVVLSLAVGFHFLSESLSPFQRSVDMGLYRWGNGIVLTGMYVALLMKAKESNGEIRLLSVFGWVLISANIVMIATVVVEAVLLGSNWLGLRPRVAQVIPPLRLPTSVRLGGIESNRPAPTLRDCDGEVKDCISPGRNNIPIISPDGHTARRPLSPVISVI